MELNGVANIKMITDEMEELVKDNKSQFGEWIDLIDKVREQVDYLERYMLAYKDAAEEACGESAHLECYQAVKPPYWHDVIRKTHEFKTLKERIHEQRSEKEEVGR